MSNRTDTEFLEDIQEAIRRISVYTHELPYKAFLSDTRTQDAVIRNLEIITVLPNALVEVKQRDTDNPNRK